MARIISLECNRACNIETSITKAVIEVKKQEKQKMIEAVELVARIAAEHALLGNGMDAPNGKYVLQVIVQRM
jgi:hypothetical protein